MNTSYRINRNSEYDSPHELVRLEQPTTDSPVPQLTSMHAQPGRGPYGDARFPGNCSGLLIRDLLRFYRPKNVFDPMTGSGTCRDVCRELEIACSSEDLQQGFDVSDEQAFPKQRLESQVYDFVWLHPPYWRMIRYSDNPRCLSNAPTAAEFFERLRSVLRNCLSVLHPTGRIAILMGDMKYERRYLGLPFGTLQAAVEEGLWLDAPEIIRPSYGASSSTKKYSGAFIPRLHDVCLVLKRA